MKSHSLIAGRPDARSYVLHRIESGEFAAGYDIPPIRALAAVAGVSLVTMWKAVGALASEGYLTGGRGRQFRVSSRVRSSGVWIGPTAAEQSGNRTTNLAWQRVASRMRRDALDGTLGPSSSLPPIKELCRTYGCAPRTMTKALRALCNEGLVKAAGRHYAVTTLSAPSARATIVVLAMREYLLEYTTGVRPSHEYLAELERCAAASGVAVRIEPVRAIGSECVIDAQSDLFATRRTASDVGYVYIPAGALSDDALLRRIASTRRPVAVIMHNVWNAPAWMLDYPICLLPVGISDSPGADAAHLLTSMGHRCAAYISPYHSYGWSQNRLRGLQAGFAQAGHADVVHACVNAVENWPHATVAANATVSIAATLPGWSEYAESSVVRQEIVRLEGHLRSRAHYLAALRVGLEPLLEQALATTRATAWVTANDEVAMVARDFLADHAVRVPRDISLVSFDDSIVALPQGLTSYNFNIPGVARAAIRHLLGRGVYPHAGGVRTERIAGFFAQRASVARTRS